MKAISSVATLPSVDEETTTATTAELSSSDFDSISNSAADSNTITTSNKSSSGGGGSGSRRKLVYSQVTTSAHNSKADITTTACTTTTNSDNNDSSSSSSSSSSSDGNNNGEEEVTSSLLRNMMGAYTNRDPYLDYISLGIIGTGSMGSVERVIKKYTRCNSNSSSNGGGVNEEKNNYDGKPQPPQQHHKPIQISFDISRRGEEHKHENINIYAAKMILNLFGSRGKKEMILSKLSSLLHHPVLLLSSTNNLRPLLPKIFFSTLNILLLTYSCDCSPCLSSYSSPYTTDTTPMLFHQLQQKDGVDDDDIDDDCNCSNNTNWLSNLFITKKTPSIIVDDTTTVNTSLQSSSSSRSATNNTITTSTTTSTTSRKYALKSLVQPDDDALIELRNEVSILRSLDHPHIAHVVDVYDCTTRKKNSSKNMKLMMYLVLDLCEGGDLYVHDPYTEIEARTIVRQLLRAVGYMHRRGIVHRDLKYENVMFTTVTPIKTIATTTTNDGGGGGGPKYYDKGKLEIKVIDFGLSKKYGKRVDMADTLMNDFVGTIYTMAPEVIKGDYTFKCDLWSVGVMAYMLLSSRMPFAGRDMREIANKIVNSNGRLSFPGERWPNISELGRDFVTTLLTYDASTRPTSEEALRHPWLSCLSLSKSGKMSTKFFGRRNSSESFGGSAHLASQQHTTTTTNKVLPVPQSAMEIVMQASRVLSSFKLLSSESRVLTSIENYSTYSWMHRLALMVIAYRYSGEETAHLRRIFTSFDIDQSGVLNSEELRVAFTMHGKYTIDELESIFLALDMTGCGTISWTEFLAATIETIGPVSEDEFSSAFDHIDLDKSGYISTQNLKDILGDKISQNTLDRIIDEADIAGDHKIWRNEFMVLANESFAVDHYDNDDDDHVMESEPRPVSLAKSLGHQPFVLGTDFTFESMDSISDYDDDDDHGSHHFGAERMKSLRKAKKQIV